MDYPARGGRHDLNGGEEIGATKVIEGLHDGFLIIRQSRVRMTEVCKGST